MSRGGSDFTPGGKNIASSSIAPGFLSTIVTCSNGTASICAHLKAGGLPHGGVSNDYGLYTPNSSDTLGLWSLKTNASGNASVQVVADVNVAAINSSHDILKIGWVDNTDTFQQTHAFRNNELEMGISSSAVLLGAEADGGSVVAVTLGSELAYSTTGAKLLSITNAGQERGYMDFSGSWVSIIDVNGGYKKEYALTEVVTITSASAYTTASTQIPADCQIEAISTRVLTTIPSGALSWSVGVTGDLNRYGDALSLNAGTTYSGMNDGVRYYASATEIIFSTHGSLPNDETGTVRFTAYVKKITPPTS